MRKLSLFEKRLIDEAKQQNAELIGAGSNKNRRLYHLSCGHDVEMSTSAMRRNKFTCQQCVEKQFIAEASEIGATIVDKTNKNGIRLYRLACGHELELGLREVRKNNFKCQLCLQQQWEKDASAQNAIMLDKTASKGKRWYLLKCGHEKELSITAMRKGIFKCKICEWERLCNAADSIGLSLLSRTLSDKWCSIVRLPCGHEREIKNAQIYAGSYRCHECNHSYLDNKSYVYLLHMKYDNREWLKFGFTKNVKQRIAQYKLHKNISIALLKSAEFETGRHANAFETKIHKQYKQNKLDISVTKDFGMSSGYTECYPMSMKSKLMTALN